MMKFFNKPVRVISATVLLSGVLFATTVDASQAVKKLDATYRNIKIIYNNAAAAVDPKTEPFVANGTTYVPLRMVSEIFDKNVTWDGQTSTITVTDKTAQYSQAVVTQLNAQITAKDTKIKQLETELANLKTQQQSKVTDLDDLEDQLNDDYGDYRDIDDVDITLSGNKNDITVKIEVDAADWKKLTTTKRTNFIQDIVDDILDEYKDADIEGTIKNANKNETLATFDIDSKDKVRLQNEAIDLDDLEYDLMRNHGTNNAIRNIDITLDGDEDDIEVTIEVNKTDWDALSATKKEDFIEAIVDDILDEYEDADVTGDIEAHTDNKRINTFEADSRGNVTIR